MTQPHTNKRAATAAAKNLLAARVTLVEELGEALDAHTKAVTAAEQAQQQVEDTADTGRKAFDAAKAGGWTAAELNSTGLHPPAALRGRPTTRRSARNDAANSAPPATEGTYPAEPLGDDDAAPATSAA